MTRNDLDDLFLHAVCRLLPFSLSAVHFPVLNCPHSLNTHHLNHAPLRMLYSFVCLASRRDLIHSCIGSPALTSRLCNEPSSSQENFIKSKSEKSHIILSGCIRDAERIRVNLEVISVSVEKDIYI